MRVVGPIRSRSAVMSILLVGILFLALPAVSHGKDSDRDRKCTAGQARPLSIAEASRDRRALEQSCVELTGFLDGSALYATLGDIYRDTEVWRDHDPNLRMVARIGLRPFPAGMKPAPSTRGLRRLTVIGRLHDCRRDWGLRASDDGEIVISMGGGWCHYNSGAVLTPTAIVAQDSVAVTRKTGRREWREFGDIAPSAADSALATEALAFLDRLIDAARRKDRRAVLDAHGYALIALAPDGENVAADELDSVVGSDANRVLELWFGNTGAILPQVHSSGARPHVRVFAPRWKTDDWPTLWGCWGAETLVEDSWPISSLDTGNVAGRPYACVKLVKERHSPGSSGAITEVWAARTYGGPALLEEPSR